MARDILFLLCGLIIYGLVNGDSSDFLNTITLVKPDVFYFSWNITSDNELIGEIQVKTTGWVSFGVRGDKGWSTGSDVIVAYVRLSSAGTSKTEFSDCYVQNNRVSIDFVQNWFLLDSKEQDGYTTIKFQRKLSLCDIDPDQDLDIGDGTPVFVWAWGNTDPTQFIDYPGEFNGSQPIPIRSTLKRKSNPNELVTQEYFNVTNVYLPNDVATTFKCRFFTFSSTTAKQLVKFETKLQAGNEDYVYEWVMYACKSSFQKTTINDNLTCNSLDDNAWKTVLTNSCNRPIVVWTKGNFLAQEFPYNLGYPVAGTTFTTFVIRVHYENTKLVQNVIDTTRILQTFATDSRRYDVGTLVVGTLPSYSGLAIPPGISDFSINSYCLSACMKAMTSSVTYINVFASVAQTFKHGTSITTKLIRNNAEVSYIGRNRYYNNEHQYTMFLDSPVVLQQGGDSENCLNYLYYYPSDPLISTCLTSRSSSDWNDFYSQLNKYVLTVRDMRGGCTLLRHSYSSATSGFRDFADHLCFNFKRSGLIFASSFPTTANTATLLLSKMTVTDKIRSDFQDFFSYAYSGNLTQTCGYDDTTKYSELFVVNQKLSDESSKCRLNKQITVKFNSLLIAISLNFAILVFKLIS